MTGKFYNICVALCLSMFIGLTVTACKNGGYLPTEQEKENGHIVKKEQSRGNITEINSNYLYALTVKGPLKGHYMLIDCRPVKQFKKYTIPTSISFSNISEKMADSLPENKSTEIIFFCENSSCNADTKAAARAERKGYENIRELREGISGWKDAGFPVVEGDG